MLGNHSKKKNKSQSIASGSELQTFRGEAHPVKMNNFIRNSHRGGIILRYFVHENQSLFHCVLNDLTTFHEP